MRYLIILILMPVIQYATRTAFRFLMPGPYEFWRTYCMIFLQHFFSIGIPLLLCYPKKKCEIDKNITPLSLTEVFRCVLLGVCMQLLGTALNYPFAILLQHFGYSMPSALPNPVNGWGFVLQTIVVCLTPAVLEEILFRQVIYNNIAKYSKKNAVFFSAMFFSMAHFDLFNLPATLFIGITLGVLRRKNISLIHCCVIHFVINFTASLINAGFNSQTFSELFHRYYPLSVFLSLTLYFAAFPKGQANAEKDVCTIKPNYGSMLLKNPLFYLYCIVFIIIGVYQL